jgi:flagellar secretion chaperone FliS
MDARSSYREADVRGASPVRLVVLLYEQMILDLTRAMQAMERHDVERRTRDINHAITVIGFLQGTLNMEQGGQVAANLVRFYYTLRAALVEAQARASSQILADQIACLLNVREAWVEIEKIESEKSAANSLPQSRNSSITTESHAPKVWNG